MVTKGKPRRKPVLAKVKTRLANAWEMWTAENPLPQQSDKYAVLEES